MIRKVTAPDFDFIYGLYMHPQVNGFLLYEWMTANEFENIFAELLAKEVLYIFEKDERRVGMFKLVPLTYRTSHIAYLGGIAIDPSFSGKGYGTLLLQEILTFARSGGFIRVELSVADINIRAIRLYEKAGFKKEGTLRKYCYLKKEDRFMDEVLMSWLSE